MASIKVNDSFTSYKDLQEAIDQYENENCVQFWKRDAKRISLAENYAPQIYRQVRDYPELEYYYIKYACIHGGQPFRPNLSKSGKRRHNRGTWKQNCRAEVSARLAKDRPVLVITNIVTEHNHEIPSREVFNQLPRQRRKLESSENKTDKSNKVKDRKSHERKSELLKNILKTNSSSRSNNFKKIAKLLEEKYNCVVDLQVDTEEKAYGFFFQDGRMKTCFKFFPDVLLMDGTYRLQNINCAIHVLSAENSFGTVDAVGVAVLTVEDMESVEWMIDRFKERNSNWDQIKVVVTDKSISEHQFIKKHFPNATPLLNQFHVLQILRKELTAEIVDLTVTECQEFLNYVTQLIVAPTEEKYKKKLDKMEDNLPYSVVQYFYKNWHEIRSEWANAFTKKARLLVNTKLESNNSKLKSSIGGCKNFNEFIDKFFNVLENKRNNFKTEFIKTIFKNPKNQHLSAYHQQLTQFAVAKIESFLNSEKQYSIKVEGSTTICETKNKRLVVSNTSCSCSFFTSVGLPCKHVLFYRRSLGLDVFDESLFSERWTKRYIRLAFGDLYLSEQPSQPTKEEKIELTQEEKFERAQGVCLELATMCSQLSGSDCERRMNMLMRLRRCWQRGQEVMIVCNGQEEVCKGEIEISEHNIELEHVDHDYSVKGNGMT